MPEDDTPEGWTDGETELLEHRVEVLTARLGVGTVVAMIDPDDEEPGRPAGMEQQEPVVLMDLFGHVHPPQELVDQGELPPCMPVTAPFHFRLSLLDQMIEELAACRVELVKRIGDVDRA